jgi:cold shock CspA family protein
MLTMPDGSYFVRKAKGSVDRFFPERGFGFVSVDDHVGPTVFFFVENVIPDQVGRVYIYPPTRVEFDLRPDVLWFSLQKGSPASQAPTGGLNIEN